MKLTKLKLTKQQREALKSFRNGWGTRLWKQELARFYNTGMKSLDVLYVRDEKILMSTKEVISPILSSLVVEYTGPDRD